MAQLRHIVDAIVAQVVDRLRWGVPTSALYSETDNNRGAYTLTRDRDIALSTGSLPIVDVRLGDEAPVSATLGKYTADLQVHVDLYARAVDGQEVSRALARLRLLTSSVLMRPSFKGTVQAASLVDLNLSPYVQSIRPGGASEVSTFQEGEIGIGTMRTTWVVRYAVNPLGLILPDTNPNAFTAVITDDASPDVGWSITAPASNGFNTDLTTFVWIVDAADGFSVTPEKVRDGLLQTGVAPTAWHGFQAKSAQTVAGTFSDLDPGDYKLHIAQIACGILDSTGPVTLEFTKTA